MAYCFDLLSIGVCATRHWQTSTGAGMGNTCTVHVHDDHSLVHSCLEILFDKSCLDFLTNPFETNLRIDRGFDKIPFGQSWFWF